MEQFGQPSALEQDAFRAVNAGDYQTFERYVFSNLFGCILFRRVVQLKALYRNNSKFVPTEQTYITMGLYLLYLLATDRIGTYNSLRYREYLPADFHTELESISSHEQNNAYIRYPIVLERYMMEGNYAKVLSESRPNVFDVLFNKLREAVSVRQQETRTQSAVFSTTVGTTDAWLPMDIMSNMVGYAADLERIV